MTEYGRSADGRVVKIVLDCGCRYEVNDYAVGPWDDVMMEEAYCLEHKNTEPEPRVEMAPYLREVRPEPADSSERSDRSRFVRPDGTFNDDAYAMSQESWQELWDLIESDCVTSSWVAVQEVKRRIGQPALDSDGNPLGGQTEYDRRQFVRPDGTFDHDAYADQDWSRVPWEDLWFLIEGDCVTSSWPAVQEVKRRIGWPARV